MSRGVNEVNTESHRNRGRTSVDSSFDSIVLRCLNDVGRHSFRWLLISLHSITRHRAPVSSRSPLRRRPLVRSTPKRALQPRVPDVPRCERSEHREPSEPWTYELQRVELAEMSRHPFRWLLISLRSITRHRAPVSSRSPLRRPLTQRTRQRARCEAGCERLCTSRAVKHVASAQAHRERESLDAPCKSTSHL